ncbi:MAG: IscS subfamily cysteine desulfurase, partial [Woeseiaceae bacterium]|nr:IscS subfamily cysteine desulfurase [Woeseiaceae bacterium]
MPGSSDFVYMDYAATTPLNSLVAERMRTVQNTACFNPASNHIAGRRSAQVVMQAAPELGLLLNVSPDSLLWTS